MGEVCILVHFPRHDRFYSCLSRIDFFRQELLPCCIRECMCQVVIKNSKDTELIMACYKSMRRHDP